ncbi:MAG: hypothetical protein ACE5H3_06825 [Planctomycetota bacterium]
MRPASEVGLLVGFLGLAPACGLFTSEPKPPPLVAVEEARLEKAADWKILREALADYLENGASAIERIRAQTAAHPRLFRLAAMLQDLERREEGIAAVRQRYLALQTSQPGPVHAWLAARVAPDRETAAKLTAEALEGDPGLTPARVLQLGIQARAGHLRSLKDLLKLLREHPASAEGWRLLERLAPLNNRPDLALHAAQTEPWDPLEPPRRSRLLQARAALDNSQPGEALHFLRDQGPEDREALLLRAAALTDLGRPGEAYGLLKGLTESDPRDPQARFNLGILARDYLDRPTAAVRHFRAFLALAEEGIEVPLFRLIQARTWLEDLEKEP